MSYDKTRQETLDHIEQVRQLMNLVCDKLQERAINHDSTKLVSPEIDHFVALEKKTADIKYGTPEYNEALKELEPALNNHYAKNRHHPQHYPNGIKGMNLIDLVEMVVDWKASTIRYKEGNILKSIEINAERFEMSEDLTAILKNTVELFEL